MTLDDVPPSADTVMTEELHRLFRYAGCDPECHACQKPIELGRIFKLVPHRKPDEEELRDEMCCAKCGEAELVKRDKREAKRIANEAASRRTSGWRPAGWSGYSRPSKEQS